MSSKIYRIAFHVRRLTLVKVINLACTAGAPELRSIRDGGTNTFRPLRKHFVLVWETILCKVERSHICGLSLYAWLRWFAWYSLAEIDDDRNNKFLSTFSFTQLRTSLLSSSTTLKQTKQAISNWGWNIPMPLIVEFNPQVNKISSSICYPCLEPIVQTLHDRVDTANSRCLGTCGRSQSSLNAELSESQTIEFE